MSDIPSIKPYLIRAIYEWCIDNGYCPYISVLEDGCSGVPTERFENKKIILNISNQSITDLLIDNDIIQFTTRFSGVSRKVRIMIGSVIAIFSRESGQGLTFVPETDIAELRDESGLDDSVLRENKVSPRRLPSADKAFLKIVK